MLFMHFFVVKVGIRKSIALNFGVSLESEWHLVLSTWRRSNYFVFNEFRYVFVMFVPYFWTLYTSYVLLFFGEALAQRNSWVDAIKNKYRLVIYLLAIVSTVAFNVASIYLSSLSSPMASAFVTRFCMWQKEYRSAW